MIAPAGPTSAATVSVSADDIRIQNLTFESGTGQARAQGAQGIALKVSGNRDVFENVHVLGDAVCAHRRSGSPSTHPSPGDPCAILQAR